MNPVSRGKKDGTLVARQAWKRFAQSSDVQGLPLHPEDTRTAALQASGSLEMTGQEEAKYMNSFQEAALAYSRKQVQELVPSKLRPKMAHFCALVTWLKTEPEAEASSDFYGITLGLVDPGAREIALGSRRIAKVAARLGRQKAHEDWKNFVDGLEPIPGRLQWREFHRDQTAFTALKMGGYAIARGMAVDSPGWKAAHERWRVAFGKAYGKELARLVKAWIPPRTRRMADQVCLLAERLEPVA